jgi:dihydroxyacetone kinase-like protein
LKKLVSKSDGTVSEPLAGMGTAHPDLIKILPEFKPVVRANAPKPKVSVISRGWSGREPMHGGFAGYGMLDAACAGEIFKAPAPLWGR